MAISENRIPWTQKWFEEGYKEGYEEEYKKAYERSLKTGYKQGIMKCLFLVLESRFEVLPNEVVEKVEQASVEVLKGWLVNSQKFITLDDIFK